MSDIFNPYMAYIIVYIDDILVYSKTLESHIKHLDVFKKDCYSKWLSYF